MVRNYGTVAERIGQVRKHINVKLFPSILLLNSINNKNNEIFFNTLRIFSEVTFFNKAIYLHTYNH